jgi:hypothetical protein
MPKTNPSVGRHGLLSMLVKSRQPLLGRVGVRILIAFFLSLLVSTIALSLLKQNTTYANETLNFQARLLTSGGAIAPDGVYNVQFRLYDQETGGSPLWTETRLTTDSSDLHVSVRSGYLSVYLGDKTGFPSSIDWNDQLYLTMNIGGTGSTADWDGEMTPRIRLTSVPFAFQADRANVAGELEDRQGSYTGSLRFDTLTTDRDILLPNRSGTVALLQGPQTFTGSLTLSGPSTSLTVTNAAVFEGDLNVASGLFFVDSDLQRIGVGTASPDAFLDVSGRSNVTQLRVSAHGVQTSDIFQITDSSDEVLAGFNSLGQIFMRNSGFTATFDTTTLTDDRTYTLPDVGGTFCLTSGNCSGVGGQVGGTGTAGRIAMFTGTSDIDDSFISQDSSGITIDTGRSLNVNNDTLFVTAGTGGRVGIGTTTPEYILDVQDGSGVVAQFSGRVIGGEAVEQDEFVTLAQLESAVGATGAYVLGGNEFGELGVLGTTDNYGLQFITNDEARLTIANDGDITIENALAVGGELTVTGAATFEDGLTVTAGGADITGDLTVAGSVGIGTDTPQTALEVVGAVTVSQLPAPDAPTVTAEGITGTTTWGYKVSATDGLGETLGSTETTITDGNAILDADDFNRITWTPVEGAIEYKIYRTTAEGTPDDVGLIGTVSAGDTLELDDTGLSATDAEPTTNTTGGASFSGRVSGADAVAANEFITLGQGNALFQTAGDYFLQGGNAFGETAVFGTTDAFGIEFITDDITRMTIADDGDVSIAESLTIGEHLTVSGGADITGDVTINTTGTATTTIGNIDAVLGLYASELELNTSTITRTAEGTLTLDLIDAADTTLALTNSGAGVAHLTIDGSLTVAGEATFGDTVTITTGGIDITGDSVIDGVLDVTGDITATGDAVFTAETDTTTTFQIQNATGTTLLNADTENMRIGIGTETPEYALDVATTDDIAARFGGRVIGAAAVEDDEFTTLAQLQNAVGAVNAFIQGGNAFEETAVLGTTDTEDLTFITDNETRLTITSGGDITIANNLAVGGTLTVTGPATFEDGITVTAGGIDITGDSTIDGTLDVTGDFRVDTDTLFVDTENDRVQIGSDADIDARLSVIGGADQTQLLVRAHSTQSLSNPLVLLQDSTGGELARLNATDSSLYLGYEAGGSTASGDNNIGIGASALGAVSTGAANTTLGSGALASVSIGSNNTAVGYNAGNLLTGSNNILLGYEAGSNLEDGSNNIIIGYNLGASAPDVSDELRIGGIIQGNLDTLELEFNGDVTVAGELTINDGLVVTAGGIDITGDSTIDGTLDVTGAATFDDGVTITDGGIDVTGDSTFTGDITATGDAVFTAETDTTTTFQIQNATGTTLLNADTENMRIGIGTETPEYALDVATTDDIAARFGGRVIGADAVEQDEFTTLAQLESAVGSVNAFLQGGNAFEETAVLGTTDTEDLTFITDNETRLTITSGGDITIANNLAVGGTLTVTGPATFEDGITVTAGGADITGDVSITGDLSVTGETTFQDVITIDAGTGIVANFSGRVVGADAVEQDEFTTLAQLQSAVGAVNAFLQGGNAFEETAVLGTTDNYDLQFITNNETRLTIANDGDITIENALAVGGQLTVVSGGADITGDVSITGELSVTGPTTFTDIVTVDAGTGLVASFSGRVSGADAVEQDEFVTLGQVSSATANVFTQQGNAFGELAVLGTTDSYGLEFITNNEVRLSISHDGALSSVQIGDGSDTSGSSTLLTLDRSDGPPVTDDDAYLGSMYYDTTIGRIQCYEDGGWGSCGSPPDNIVNLDAEYAGAVLNGSGIGTMTADFCANESGVLSVNSSLCGEGEALNFYRWTSPQATEQEYSIYVTYQLPTTFDGFASDETVQLTARRDNSNAEVSYEMFRSEGGQITQCGTETVVTTADNVWQTVGINGDEATDCGFSAASANGYVIFKINMKSSNNANAYSGTLTFTTTGR